jgi:hypothetical protein
MDDCSEKDWQSIGDKLLSVVNGKTSKHFGTSLSSSAYTEEQLSQFWQTAAGSHRSTVPSA